MLNTHENYTDEMLIGFSFYDEAENLVLKRKQLMRECQRRLSALYDKRQKIRNSAQLLKSLRFTHEYFRDHALDTYALLLQALDIEIKKQLTLWDSLQKPILLEDDQDSDGSEGATTVDNLLDQLYDCIVATLAAEKNAFALNIRNMPMTDGSTGLEVDLHPQITTEHLLHTLGGGRKGKAKAGRAAKAKRIKKQRKQKTPQQKGKKSKRTTIA